MNKLYVIYDKVKDEENAVFMAKNDKDCIRELVFCNYFKMNRLDDTEIWFTGLTIDKDGVLNTSDERAKLNIKEICEELSFSMENKAEKIEGTEDEVKEKIVNECIEKLDENTK